jgi:hypothetical protein
MILDFTEIPPANGSNGLQDTFELFARDLLECIGYEIVDGPNRGADGKKDMIVKETRKGIGGHTSILWLVSCKHYAKGGKSVTDLDESDIVDRVRKHNCDGFIGFYSTVPSTALSTKLSGLKKEFESVIFDREKIEHKVTQSKAGRELAGRYFPKSFELYLNENPSPVKIFKKDVVIKCENCGKDIFKDLQGIWVGLAKIENKGRRSKKIPTHQAYFSCKGECDMRLRAYYYNKGYDDRGWLEVSHFLNPHGFLYELLDFLHRLSLYDLHPDALQKIMLLFKASYPHVMRKPTEKEKHFHRHFDDYEDLTQIE